jgi:hypothetical protein
MWTSSSCTLDDVALVCVLTHGTHVASLMWTSSDVAFI